MIRFLESKNVILTPQSKQFLNSGNYISWINNQSSDKYTQHALFPHTFESVEAYIDSKHRVKNNVWLGIVYKKDNMHIGNIDISDIDWINGVGTYNILIGDNKYHGKGIGYEASHLILNHVFTRFNLHRIQLGVDERNISAQKLYNKLGFKKEGIFEDGIFENNNYFNIIRMRLLKKDYLIDNEIL